MSVQTALAFLVLGGIIVQSTARNYVSIPANSNIYYDNARRSCYIDRGRTPVLVPLTRDITFDVMTYEQITVEYNGTYEHIPGDFEGWHRCDNQEIRNITGTRVEFQILDRRDRGLHTLISFVFINEQDFVNHLRSSIKTAS